MNRHTTKKQTWVFGILFVFTAALFGITGAKLVNAEGKTATEDVDVKFTFNSMLKLDMDKEGITISELLPGNAKESDEVKLTITTNAEGGYYLSATAGTKGGDANLNNENGDKFTMMAPDADKATINDADDSTWGFAYVKGAGGDLSKSHFNGLSLDADDSGATGVKLIDANSNTDEKVVKFKIGAKAGLTTTYGTYTNQLNFYAVTKN